MSGDVQQTGTPPKYSRYRSVRQAVTSLSATSTLPKQQQQQQQQDDQPKSVALKKSMSRYRRTRISTNEQSAHTNPPPLPQQYPPPLQSPRSGNDMRAHHMSQEPASRPKTVDAVTRRRADDRVLPTEGQRIRNVSGQDRDELRKRHDSKNLLYGDLIQNEESQQRASGEEALQMLEEQKRRDLERLDAELAAATAARPATAGLLSPGIKSPGRERFNFFSRKRGPAKPMVPKTPESDTIMQSQINELPVPIVQGGGGAAVPGTDAPISAVNAGERRVLVRCKQSSINLPVTPNTTPIDIAYSAANILSQGVTPANAVLLESYTQLGLERPLRRYEHIRDVMNSWDRDTQNALLLKASDSPGNDQELTLSSVPKERPSDFTAYMYHSQKPGKWNKRYITLMSTGQVYSSKKSVSKVSEKDSLSLCHMSDFDIYSPCQQQLRKNLKPPKKHCYAIKSQQKTTMFLNTENFVHFFSTDDHRLADKWYNAVQQWRSWYLVNQMGEGPKVSLIHQATVKSSSRGRSGTTNGQSQPHNTQISVDETPYTIGTFSPLMDVSRFDNASPRIEDENDENRARQIPFHLRHSIIGPSSRKKDRHPPPVAYQHRLSSTGNEPSDVNKDFAPTGLLGRTYTQRQNAQREKENAPLDADIGPFTGGLLNSVSTATERPSTSIDRGVSVRKSSTARPNTSHRPKTASGQPQPLVDLELRNEEMPRHWTKKGHGVHVKSGVPLVEVANTPEGALLDYQMSVSKGGQFVKGSLLERGGGAT